MKRVVIGSLLLFLLSAVGCASQPTRAISTSTPVAAPTALPNPTPSSSAVPTSLAPTASPGRATLTGLPTSQPTPKPSAPEPQVISFSVTPTTTTGLNEPVSLAWEAKGEKAEVCRIGNAGPFGCQPVPLIGKLTLVTDQTSPLTYALGLRVYVGQVSTLSLVNVSQCINSTQWFLGNPPPRCPEGPSKNSHAAAQFFEHGFMVWVEAWDTFYVFYSGAPQTFQMLAAPYNFKPGASAGNRVGETPPRGQLEPVSGFGQIWRGEMIGIDGARQRLGWATAPEFSFDTTYQCEATGASRLWSCYLRGPRGKVLWLSPDSTANVNLVWEEF